MAFLTLSYDSKAQFHLPVGRNRATDTGFFYIHTGCKLSVPVLVVLYADQPGDTQLPVIHPKYDGMQPVVTHNPLLVIHGNVTYDAYYQSNADTPFLEKDIYQQSLQTDLDIIVKERYPLHLSVNTSKGNSQLFRNITGINFQYNDQDFKNILIAKARNWDAGRLKQRIALDQLKEELNADWNNLNRLKAWFSAPAQLQRMAEVKEKEYRLKILDSLNRISKHPLLGFPYTLKEEFSREDTLLIGFREECGKKKILLDSLRKLFEEKEKRFRQKESTYGARKGSLMDALQYSRNNQVLKERLEILNLPDSILPKGYKTMLAVKSFGLGRAQVNYSELTAMNISIMGAQVEINPSWYVAFATGAVDYRFRDFIVNDNRIHQYLTMIRIGEGMKDGNHIIFSFYTGKKQVYNFNTTDQQAGNIVPQDFNIMGISLEGRWQLNKNNYLVGEVAKSSLPYYARNAQHMGIGSSILMFNEHSNEAYTVKLFSFIPRTDTRIDAMYKRMGANFQSFSLYATGSAQNAWMLQVIQPFFKRQLMLTGSVRKNVYTSIFDNAAYRSNTAFKSIQATFRRKKWPVLSIGYFPSSQLVKLSDNKYMENLYYTLVATGSYFYKFRNIDMNTIFSQTKFYNHQSDSNFVYFNSVNLLLNQTAFIGKFTFSGAGSFATTNDYRLYGMDGGMQYKILSWLESGAGLKYNYQTEFEIRQIGYSANIRISMPKIGSVNISGEKGFIPGINKRLVPNETGRLTYTKIF